MKKSGFEYVCLMGLIAALGLWAVVSAEAQDITSDLEGHWTFESFEDGVANDVSGNSRDAVIAAGLPILAPGKIGNAIYFDGESDLVAPWKGVSGNNPRTICLWINTTTDPTTGNGLVGWGTNNPGEKWHFRLNDNSGNGVVGAIRTEFAGSQNVATTLVNDGQWHFVVSVFDGEFPGDTVHYVDGEFDERSWVGDETIVVNTTEGDDVTIGSRLQGTTYNRVNATLDEVRIYSRALSAEDIQALYELGQVEQTNANRSFSSNAVRVGDSIDVTLTFPEGTSGTLTETVPEGWEVSDPSDNGQIDGNTITWSISSGQLSVSYSVSPTSAAADNPNGIFTGLLNGLVTGGPPRVFFVQSGEGDFDFQADIGVVDAAGSASYDGSTYFVEGSGADIGGAADEFHYLYREVSGPFNIRTLAFPNPFESTSDSMKAGPMIRQEITPDSVFMMGFVQTQFDQQSIWRIEKGASAQTGTAVTLTDMDITGAIELRRRGNVIQTWFELGDGSWTQHSEAVIPELSDPLYVGLAVTSNQDGAISVGEFQDVNLELIPFAANRLVTAGEKPMFGDTFTVSIDIFSRETQDINVIEVPPTGWPVGSVTATAGSASADAGGAITWNISNHQGSASLNYELMAPESSSYPVITGLFEGMVNGNELQGDTEIKVKGLLPEETLLQQDITSSLEAYWKFDEGSGEEVADSSGNDRIAAFRNGDPVWVEGIQGTALEFNGDDDLSAIDWYGITGNAPRTISYWINTTWAVDASSGIVGWGFSTENGTKWHTRLNNNADNGTVGAIRTEIQGNYFIGSTPINDGEWHHVVSVFPQGGQYMADVIHYVDGLEEEMSGTNTGGADIEVNTAGVDEGGTEVEIGSRLQGTSQQFYIGTLDEVRIYSRGLMVAEVQALYVTEGGDITDVDDFMLY